MIIGITGKIASGKTSRMKELEQEGFYCIYADEIVHELFEPGERGSQIVEEFFGNEYLDSNGKVNRIKLRNLVFNNRNELDRLNSVIHPLVHEIVGKKIIDHENVAIESFYFYKGCLEDYVDRIEVIERSDADILDTLVNERGFSPELAKKAINL